MQPGLRTTGLMEATQPTKGNMQSFLNALYIVLKLYLCCPAFPKREKKLVHKMYSCSTDPQANSGPSYETYKVVGIERKQGTLEPAT